MVLESQMKQDEDGATPVTPDQAAALRLTHITTRGELNEAEQENILTAHDWIDRRRNRSPLTLAFLRELHRRMFGQVWKWGGTFTDEANRAIGLDPHEIGPALRMLIDDVKYWIEKETYPPDEIAARFHHRLTQIHAFPNGNGRHARLATDLLLKQLGQPPFTWGGKELRREGEDRRAYLAALRQADRLSDYEDLLRVLRS
jgi:Fic-DOC domain mobile mystery protein B